MSYASVPPSSLTFFFNNNTRLTEKTNIQKSNILPRRIRAYNVFVVVFKNSVERGVLWPFPSLFASNTRGRAALQTYNKMHEDEGEHRNSIREIKGLPRILLPKRKLEKLTISLLKVNIRTSKETYYTNSSVWGLCVPIVMFLFVLNVLLHFIPQKITNHCRLYFCYFCGSSCCCCWWNEKISSRVNLSFI